MRYYFGAEARLRRRIEDTIMQVFAGWCYEEIITPAVDYLALFERGMGRDEAHRAFRFTDADGRLLALRPDVTSSVARAAATLFARSSRPLRLCYAAPVFRRQTQSRAEWRRESTQLGCEFIGAGGQRADVEVLVIAAEIFDRLGLQSDYRITINNVEVFNGISERLSLGADARERMRHLIDIRDGAELQQFLAEYETEADDRAAFTRLTQLPGRREVLARARRVITNGRSVAALDTLEELWRTVEELNLPDHFEIDLGDVSRLDYYTGLTFKIYTAGAGRRVGGGGRYDLLTANFGKTEPAVGFMLELDALTDVLLRRSGPAAPTADSDSDAAPVASDETDALELLERAGIRAGADARNSRRLAVEDESGSYRFIFVKPSDVPVYVEHGTADCGIVGRDVLLEAGADLLQPLDLRISSCRIAVASCAGALPSELGALRVATKYPRIAAAHFGARGIPVEIIELAGSVELAPVLGLADAIVDVVETGRTLAENGLSVVEEIADSTGRLVVNRASYQLKAEAVSRLIGALKGVLGED